MNNTQWARPVLAACAVAAALATTSVAQAVDLVPVLHWVPCGADFPAAECAVAQVPLDYDQPHGATTELALARIPAADQARKLGTVFLNPGGPGGSGVDFVLFGFGEDLAQKLGGRFDVVGFDPRGVAASATLQCFDSNAERNAFFADAPVFPHQPNQLRPFFELFRSIAPTCFARRQPIARHMSTADVARDLDLLRQAVGDRGLTYLGFSYGSYLGTTYARLFPDNIRALVIDGVLDPQLWSGGLQIVSDRVATAQEFAEFLRLCDEAAEACALSGAEGADARFDALAAALRAAPLVFDDGSVYSYDFLIGDAATAMYVPELWGGADGYGAYFAVLADAVGGDRAAARQAAALRAAIAERLRRASPHRADYDNGLEAYFGNQCADTEYPRTFARYRGFAAFAERGSIFGLYWWSANAGCADWPVAADRFVGPWRVRTSAPVLVVGNFFDGVTDYAGAVASNRLLTNSRLLSYAGWGHTAFNRSACVTQHIIGYLVDGALPQAGTVCPANPNPFLSPVAAGVAGRAMPMNGLPPLRPTR